MIDPALPGSRQGMAHDRRLGLRLGLACLAAFLVLVPFTGLLALVDTKWGPLRRLDDGSTRHLNHYVLGHRWMIDPLRATSYVFHAWVFRGIVAVLVVWLVVKGARRLAAWAAVTMVAAGVLDLATKTLVHRPRPKLPTAIAHAPGGSFPSGHAMTAVVGCAVIVLILLPMVRTALAWTVAAVISFCSGACRVLLGVHFVSDVLAGWILGAAVVIATVAAFETWRRHDEHRRPVDPAAEGVEPEFHT